MANKRVSVDIPEGKLSAGYGGGSYRSGGGFAARRGGGLKGFDPPKSFSGEAAPKMDRLGRTKAPVEQVKPAEKKQMYDIERPFLREGDTPRRFQNGNKQSEGLTKEELGRIGDVNVQQMREAQAKRAAEKRRATNPDQADEAQRTVTEQQMEERRARMQKFGIDPKRYGYAKGGPVKFAKGGMVQNYGRGGHDGTAQCRDYKK